MRHRLIHAYHSMEDRILLERRDGRVTGMDKEIRSLIADGLAGLENEEWHE